ncbi:MAG TPA: DUF2993 domain-containing protein [Acidimicrobiales bacterium]|nr:DUF2993 domain-containing protein [Acidimicrobiales bacterium]
MRKLILAGLGVLVLFGIDQAARLAAEHALAERASRAANHPLSARASISSFPFLPRLLVLGRIRQAEVRVTGVRTGPVRLTAVEVEGTGVKVSRAALLKGQVHLEDIDQGRVTVELGGPALSDALHVPVHVEGDTVEVGGLGLRAAASVSVDRGSLVVRLAGLPTLTMPAVRIPLVPCDATSVAVAGQRVRLTCELDDMPEALKK